MYCCLGQETVEHQAAQEYNYHRGGRLQAQGVQGCTGGTVQLWGPCLQGEFQTGSAKIVSTSGQEIMS